MKQDRDIEVLRLSRRIAAEVESGRVDEVELDEEQLARVAGLLAPTPPRLPTRSKRRPPVSAVVIAIAILLVHEIAVYANEYRRLLTAVIS